MALEDKARGQRIAQLRKRRRLTQQAMAERLRIGYRTYQTWEGGTMPEYGNLEKLAKFFGVKPEYLIGEEGVFPDAVSQLDRIEQKLDVVLRRLDALEQIQSRLGHLDDDARKTWTELAAHDMEVMSRLDAVERTMRDRSQEEPPR